MRGAKVCGVVICTTASGSSGGVTLPYNRSQNTACDVTLAAAGGTSSDAGDTCTGGLCGTGRSQQKRSSSRFEGCLLVRGHRDVVPETHS